MCGVSSELSMQMKRNIRGKTMDERLNGVNPITVIKGSGFSHYLIDHEFVFEMIMYENMFLQLMEIRSKIDELDKLEKQKWYYPLPLIKGFVDCWKQKSLCNKILLILFWVCCFVIGLLL